MDSDTLPIMQGRNFTIFWGGMRAVYEAIDFVGLCPEIVSGMP